jgi:CRP-like cAMP-binding protein
VRCEPGRLLCQEALIPEEVVFLLDGRVVLKNQAGETRQLEAPAALGFEELLEDNPMVESARTIEAAVCLTLAGEEIRLLLADNAQLASGLFQMVCSRSDQTVRLVVKGNPSEQGLAATGSELKPIEKGLVLKTVPLFSDVSPQDMIALAAVASEVRLPAGSQLFSEADPPAFYALVSGELCVESLSNGPELHAGPSDVIGLYETLAGIGLACRARVTAEGIALRIDREDLFDLLAQHSGLLRQIFSTLFRMRASRQTPA